MCHCTVLEFDRVITVGCKLEGFGLVDGEGGDDAGFTGDGKGCQGEIARNLATETSAEFYHSGGNG